MPMYIDSENVIVRITLDDAQPVGEQPLQESWGRKVMDNIWFLVFGMTR